MYPVNWVPPTLPHVILIISEYVLIATIAHAMVCKHHIDIMNNSLPHMNSVTPHTELRSAAARAE
jgi:hypothetical protein